MWTRRWRCFLVRYKKPRSFIGIVSDSAINWCKTHFQFKNTSWVQGYAELLPVANASTDVIINVEYSHCYPSMTNFLKEVSRILRPNGYFAFCDLRRSLGIKSLDTAITKSGLDLIKQQEITLQVLNALKQISETRDTQITSVFPILFRPAIRDSPRLKILLFIKC
ncbi:MAG: class I SAM-dependent methyltransferase [Rickettsiella sp.]|nr:class I SAM-dependent methyltransferase [Rickettsiella sp.]